MGSRRRYGAAPPSRRGVPCPPVAVCPSPPVGLGGIRGSGAPSLVSSWGVRTLPVSVCLCAAAPPHPIGTARPPHPPRGAPMLSQPLVVPTVGSLTGGGGRAPLSFLARCQRGQPVGAECCRRMGRGPPRCPTAPPGGRGPFPPPCFAWRGGSPLFAVCPQGRAVTPHPRPFCGAPKEAAGGPRPIEPLSGVGAAALLGSTQQRSSPPPHPPSVPRCAVWGPPFVLAPASRCHRILRGPDPIRCPLPSPHSPEPPLSPLPPP